MTASLLLLLDDIASVLDDVATLSKVVVKKTAGVVGDDLALSAQQLSGMRAERELDLILAVAKGSLVNKAVLVPSALLISWLAPWLISPLLVAGGAYLCFEGAEKILHRIFHKAAVKARLSAPVAGTPGMPMGHKAALEAEKIEKEQIKGAVRTDFILSAEIIVIALGAVAQSSLLSQLIVLIGVAVVMTVGVYGLVALIVKLDDIGLALCTWPSRTAQATGRGLLAFAPWLLRLLGIVGTAAMFLVGGGILTHAMPALQHLLGEHPVMTSLNDACVGLLLGVVVAGVVTLAQKCRSKLGY